MKSYSFEQIASSLGGLIDRTLRSVESRTVELIKTAAKNENGAARWALETIAENAAACESQSCFACQDCGLALVFAEVGTDARIDFSLTDAINEGVRRGYRDARKSCAHPLTRLNTGDNTPAVIYTELVSGDGIKLSYLAKGAGSENMSAVYMLTPSKGEDGIIASVVDCIVKAGANPCPPVIVGVGIGGTMDKAAVLSKKALLRPAGESNSDGQVAALEKRILTALNETGIGAQGLGGNTTALAAHVEVFPTHIGMLPVAVTVQCHSVRHGSITI